MNNELVDVVVSHEALESTGYETLEHVAECCERFVDKKIGRSLRNGKWFSFNGTDSDCTALTQGAAAMVEAYSQGNNSAEELSETVFRSFCFARNFVALLRRFRPALYSPSSPLAFNPNIDTRLINTAFSFSRERKLLTRYADWAAWANDTPGPIARNMSKAAIFYVFLQAEEQAYGAFIDQQVDIFAGWLQQWDTGYIEH